MRSVFSIVFMMALAPSSAFPADCVYDRALAAAGWIRHEAAQFPAVKARMKAALADQSSWLPDLETRFISGSLGREVHFQSFDDLRTPQDEMFGDVVFYSDGESDEPLEIRWYEDRQKHYVISGTQCSCDSAPYAENALF